MENDSDWPESRRLQLPSFRKSLVPDQVKTLSQIGTKKISKEAGPFWNFLSHVGTVT